MWTRRVPVVVTQLCLLVTQGTVPEHRGRAALTPDPRADYRLPPAQGLLQHGATRA